MNDFQVAYYTIVPVWAIVGWTLSVWGGLIGVALFLLRRAAAQELFLLSLLSNLIYDSYIYGLSPGIEAMEVIRWMPIFIPTLTGAMAGNCDRLRSRHVLVRRQRSG